MNYLEYKGYLGSVEYSSEDDILFGKIIGLQNSSISYEGNTLAELKEDFHQAVDDYLSSFPDESQIEKPCKGTFNVRIGPELHLQAVIKAKQNNESLNNFVKDAIIKHLAADN